MPGGDALKLQAEDSVHLVGGDLSAIHKLQLHK
jgi:hypothetical protein